MEVRATIVASVDADRSATPSGDTVTAIDSPYGSAKPGQQLVTSTNAEPAAPLLIGVDAAGQMKLLKYEAGGAPLSADTTLYALVRLALNVGDRPTDMAASAPLGQIRKSANYPAGLATLRAALASATATPLQTQGVVDIVTAIANDAIALAARPAGAAVSLASSSATPAPASVTSLPYYFWNNSAIDRTWLAQDAGLWFKNRTFLAWHVSTATDSGVIGEATAPAMDQTTRQLLANYADSETSTQLKEPPERFTVTLDQNRATQLINAHLMVTRSTFAILEVGLGAAGVAPSRLQECTLSVAETIMADQKFAEVLIDFSVQAVADFLWEKKADVFKAVLLDCSKDGETAAESIKDKVIKLTNAVFQSNLNRLYKALTAARSATAAYGSWSQFIRYANLPATRIEMCRYNGAISPCITRLEAAPIEVGVGDTADLTIRAYDVGGNLLATPPTLTVASDQTGIAQPALAGYRVTGVAAGEAQLSIVDTVSRKSTVMRVVVTASAPPFSSSVKLSGPAALTGLSCSGTYSIIADATLAPEGDALRLHLVGNEDIALSCYHQNTPSDMSVSLIKSGNGYKGSVNLPFTCAPPCNSGSTTLSADLVLTGTGAEQGLAGSIVVINENKTPFYARAEGNVRLRLP